MKNERLLNALGKIDEELIAEAAPGNKPLKKKANRKTWIKWGAMAACVCLIIGVGSFLFDRGGHNDSGGGNVSGTTFMSYAGPVFPLNALNDATGIAAQRNIDFDFSPYGKYRTESIVSDNYTLHNTSNQDIVLTASYPFASNFYDGYRYMPDIHVNGEETAIKLYAGKFTGSFYSVHGQNSDQTDRSNIASPEAWTDFQTLLEDGSYLDDAYAEYPQLNQSVIVYKLSNLAYNGTDGATNPTLCMEFNAKSPDTLILSYGSTGGSRNRETGEFQQSYHIPAENEIDYGKDKYLIVLGEDIANLRLQGYRDGGCDEGEDIDGATADIERYETTLGEIVWQLLIEERNLSWYFDEEQVDIASDEMLYGSIAELMYDYGILSDNVAERYAWGSLEDMWSETYYMERVMYVTFEVLIPANGSVQVDAVMVKNASMDFTGEEPDRNGFDLVTGLGSSLKFSNQTVSVSNAECIEIIYQNFGFDLENGITQVELDVNEPHYYMEVRQINIDDVKSD